MKCDTVLKDVSKFHFREAGGLTRSNRCTNEILPQPQTAQQLAEPKGTVTLSHPERPP